MEAAQDVAHEAGGLEKAASLDRAKKTGPGRRVAPRVRRRSRQDFPRGLSTFSLHYVATLEIVAAKV